MMRIEGKTIPQGCGVDQIRLGTTDGARSSLSQTRVASFAVHEVTESPTAVAAYFFESSPIAIGSGKPQADTGKWGDQAARPRAFGSSCEPVNVTTQCQHLIIVTSSVNPFSDNSRSPCSLHKSFIVSR
jgi:hypothetical protein